MAMDIVDTAVAAGDFTTLAQALTAAGLVETLKGPGPFTVFAPTDEAFATNAARVQHQQPVIDAIEAFTTVRTKEEIAAVLGGKVPFGPVYTAAEIFADPHYAVREMLVEVEQPGSARPVKIAGVPIKLSDTPGAVRRRAPLLGEHTEEILLATGYTERDIKGLRETKAVR